MKVSRKVVAQIVRRALDAQRPRLFDDAWSAKRSRRRLERLARWAGPSEYVIAISIASGSKLANPEKTIRIDLSRRGLKRVVEGIKPVTA